MTGTMAMTATEYTEMFFWSGFRLALASLAWPE